MATGCKSIKKFESRGPRSQGPRSVRPRTNQGPGSEESLGASSNKRAHPYNSVIELSSDEEVSSTKPLGGNVNPRTRIIRINRELADRELNLGAAGAPRPFVPIKPSTGNDFFDRITGSVLEPSMRSKLLKAIKACMTEVYPQWLLVPPAEKDLMCQEWMSSYAVRPEDKQRARYAFMSHAPQLYRTIRTLAHSRPTEGFQAVSNRNKKNQLTPRDEAHPHRYTGGFKEKQGKPGTFPKRTHKTTVRAKPGKHVAPPYDSTSQLPNLPGYASSEHSFVHGCNSTHSAVRNHSSHAPPSQYNNGNDLHRQLKALKKKVVELELKNQISEAAIKRGHQLMGKFETSKDDPAWFYRAFAETVKQESHKAFQKIGPDVISEYKRKAIDSDEMMETALRRVRDELNRSLI